MNRHERKLYDAALALPARAATAMKALNDTRASAHGGAYLEIVGRLRAVEARYQRRAKTGVAVNGSSDRLHIELARCFNDLSAHQHASIQATADAGRNLAKLLFEAAALCLKMADALAAPEREEAERERAEAEAAAEAKRAEDEEWERRQRASKALQERARADAIARGVHPDDL